MAIPRRGCSYRNDVRMNFFDCNAPGTSGYSAAISGVRISKLHAHHAHAGTELYDETDGSCGSTLWIHMPVDQGECLKEIWAVWHALGGFYGLVVRPTNAFHLKHSSAHQQASSS